MDLYTRESGKVGCIIYATGQEKEEAAESYPETEAVIHHWLSHRGSYLPLPIFLSLSLFSSPYPFLFDPLVKGLGTPRVACPVIPVKRIISLFETLAILWSPPLFIPGRWVGWWRVARCASSLFVSSYSPVFRTRVYVYTRFTTPYGEESGRATPDRGVYYAARDTSRRWVREIRADKQEVKEVLTVCRRPVASPFHHGFCYKIL